MNIYLQAQSWCLENNIKVYIVPIKGKKECYIEIYDDNRLIRSPKKYKNQSIASSKIWDLYLYLYNKKTDNGKNS
jgi:hypothetical protein|tara:strand:- start:1013 stop:1237 length:225 start_codon:yes stop_codon:yes gene_type:complete